ncbi:gamma carbonic anhydrase family protein [Deinococcus sp. QL22]|uniref:gamma carbonic anhydrase family protein n=1 Tax=Deinococcus sp. QL22 TaxID=2939437 RepID=UPI002017654D|nr:gamma carbonic anhydrase family protein [Deinococcus sp. QL22]UQN06365.1 gamma carbonic anhydrase family protein [Deinococcus sp. QL22]
MPLYALAESSPDVHSSAFIAPSADLIGRVTVAEGASVWFGAVLRGDLEAITVGAGSNIQDGAVLHSDPGFPCTLEAGVTVGHRAIVHGAWCGAGSLVGMGATMLNGSRLGTGAVLGAGALLPEGREVPAGMLAVGIPARVVGPVAAPANADRYRQNAGRYRAELRPVTPAAQAEAGA